MCPLCLHVHIKCYRKKKREKKKIDPLGSPLISLQGELSLITEFFPLQYIFMHLPRHTFVGAPVPQCSLLKDLVGSVNLKVPRGLYPLLSHFISGECAPKIWQS